MSDMHETPSDPIPRSLKGDQTVLAIEWSDGRTDRIPWRTLRDQCPCATCRAKRAEPPPPPAAFTILKSEETLPLRAAGMSLIGNYAYQIDFSDGHKTGIYSLELLRTLGEGVDST